MKYEKTTEARFIRRLNRFAAEVLLDGEVIAVHVKNTGRLRELLTEGAPVVLADSGDRLRKYRYDLITVWHERHGWVNIDSQACNKVFREWLMQSPEGFEDIACVKPEYVYGASRIDFLAVSPSRRVLIEVKGCTLESGGTGLFPDAPTGRGVRHLRELASAAGEGYECFIAFVIAVPGVSEVRANISAQPEFGTELEKAVQAGVKVLFCACDVRPDGITIKNAVTRGK